MNFIPSYAIIYVSLEEIIENWKTIGVDYYFIQACKIMDSEVVDDVKCLRSACSEYKRQTQHTGD